jgi:hypothetical protein
MKITLEQLKRLIRETVEESIFMDPDDPENTNNPLNHPHSRDLLKGISPEELEDRRRQGAKVEQGFSNPKPSRHGEKSLSDRDFLPENKIRMIYTNHGILTEEHVRELKEYGYEMEECGSWEVENPVVHMSHGMSDPSSKIILIRGDGLEEGDTSSPADDGSVTGTQVALSMPNGPGGSPSPSGANVPYSSEPNSKPDVVVPPSMDMKRENYNRHVERLLEAWMEEEVEEELHGDQDKLDLDDDGEIEASDLAMLRHGLTDKQVGEDRKRS